MFQEMQAAVSGGGAKQISGKPFTFGNAVNCGFEPKKIVYQVTDSTIGSVLIVYDNGKLEEYYYYSGEQYYDITSSLSSFLDISSTGYTIKKASGSWVVQQYYAYAEG